MAFADDLTERMEPWLSDPTTVNLDVFINAIGAMFDPLANIIEGDDVDAGWGAILNPNTFPSETYNLGYLSQFLGVQLPAGLSIPQELALITAETGFFVGSQKAIMGAVALNLNPGATSAVFQKGQRANGTQNPWWFTITYRLSDAAGTVMTSGNVTEGSAVISGIASTTGFLPGAPVAGAGIPGQTLIQSVNSSTQLTMTNPATATTSADPLAVGSLAAFTAMKNSIAKVQQAGSLFDLVPTVGFTWAQANVEWQQDPRTWSQAATEPA